MSRHTGSGDATIRVAPRSEHAGPRLYIGRALYQAIGAPARVALSIHGATLIIEAGTDYAAHAPANGMPRISIGAETLERLTLEPGYFAARVTRDQRIAVDLAKPANTERPSGAWLRATRTGLRLSRPALARKAGVGHTMIQRWEDDSLTGSRYTALQQRVVATLEQLSKPARPSDG